MNRKVISLILLIISIGLCYYVIKYGKADGGAAQTVCTTPVGRITSITPHDSCLKISDDTNVCNDGTISFLNQCKEAYYLPDGTMFGPDLSTTDNNTDWSQWKPQVLNWTRKITGSHWSGGLPGVIKPTGFTLDQDGNEVITLKGTTTVGVTNVCNGKPEAKITSISPHSDCLKISTTSCSADITLVNSCQNDYYQEFQSDEGNLTNDRYPTLSYSSLRPGADTHPQGATWSVNLTNSTNNKSIMVKGTNSIENLRVPPYYPRDKFGEMFYPIVYLDEYGVMLLSIVIVSFLGVVTILYLTQ